ncbi:MAG: hypothetical protein Q7U84_10880 [Polynucleobacter sp.]|nr:hypothetical protein [Polynucleobacter sp.]
MKTQVKSEKASSLKTSKVRKPGASIDAVQSSSQPQVVQADRLPANVQIYYADQLIDALYGVHTCKLVFGVDTGSGHVRPTGTLVIPTSALLVMVSSILSDLTAQDIINEAEGRYAGLIQRMRELAPDSGAGEIQSGT